MIGLATILAVYLPLSFGIAVVLAAYGEREPRRIPRRALKTWGILLLASALALALITIAQDPWLVLGT